jgi:hypothetical protein
MYNLTNYTEIKSTLVKRVLRLSEKFTYLEKVIDVEDIKVSYSKKIFENTANQELYLATTNKFVIITWEPFIIRTYNVKDIVKTETEMGSPYEIRMKITFSNGDSVELDNKVDSNPEWAEDYYVYILNVNKYLTNL